MMEVCYRKNKEWTTVFVSINIVNLCNLGDVVKQKIIEQKKIDNTSETWKIIDIVDTKIVSTSFNQHRNETMIDMIVHVVDISDKK